MAEIILILIGIEMIIVGAFRAKKAYSIIQRIKRIREDDHI